MAKFALVGYGSKGEGVGKNAPNGYTYVVNDNVRTDDLIQPIATSSRGRKFVTTGKVRNAYNETSAKGKELKVQTEENLAKGENKKYASEISRAYSGKELTGGKKTTSQEKLRKLQVERYVAENPNQELTENTANYLGGNESETFDSYSKKFMGGQNG